MNSLDVPPLPSPLESHLGFWLRFVSNHVSLRFRQLLQTHGVSVTDWVALRCLCSGKVRSHPELVDALGLTKGAVSKVVSRLEQKGLLERLPAEGVDRERHLVLTVAGQALVPQLAALADANDAYFFGHLPEVERIALSQSMRALVLHHRFTSVPIS